MNFQTRTPDDFIRRRKARWRSYIVGGVIFLIFIILVFLYIILRVRSIKLRLHTAKVENLITSESSISMLLHTQVTIKNSNFGHYKFRNNTLILAYKGTHVGEVGFESGRVKARSVKKIDVVVAVSLKNWMGFGSGHGGLGKITLTASSHVTGKVHILKAIRRRKVAQMNCVIDVDTKAQVINNLHCK